MTEAILAFSMAGGSRRRAIARKDMIATPSIVHVAEATTRRDVIATAVRSKSRARASLRRAVSVRTLTSSKRVGTVILVFVRSSRFAHPLASRAHKWAYHVAR